jgi:hypothetical protein
VVKNYLRSICDKTGVSDRLELALFTAQNRILAAASAQAVTISHLSDSIEIDGIHPVTA